MSETKFDRSKCRSCIYRGRVSGGQQYIKGERINNVCCNYAAITGNTCLKYNNAHKLDDIRGDNYDECKLYKKGKAIQNTPDSIVPRRV